MKTVSHMPVRVDRHGDGHFGARRGNGRKHLGVDLVVEPGAYIVCPVNGRFGDLGYAYHGDTRFRIVDIDIDDPVTARLRIFYAEFSNPPLGPSVKRWNSSLIVAQDIRQRYDHLVDFEMVPHIHVEFISGVTRSFYYNWLEVEPLLDRYYGSIGTVGDKDEFKKRLSELPYLRRRRG